MTKSQEKYYKIVCPLNKEEASDGQGNNLLVKIYGALITIFPCGSTNMLMGSRESKFWMLQELVGQERQLQFCLPNNGDRFLTKFINYFSTDNYSLDVDFNSKCIIN